MKHFIGTKRVLATLMNRGDYNEYRKWDIPANENPEDAGYLVEYLDGGESNHDDHEGYISWSPKSVFEAAYQASGSMNFGHAVELLKGGHKVARSGWNGKGMFLFLVAGSNFQVNRAPLNEIYDHGTVINYNPHIDIKNVDGSISTWAPSNGDALAEDWQIVE